MATKTNASPISIRDSRLNLEENVINPTSRNTPQSLGNQPIINIPYSIPMQEKQLDYKF